MNAVVGGGAGLLVMGVLEWRSVKGGIINGSTGALCVCVGGVRDSTAKARAVLGEPWEEAEKESLSIHLHWIWEA